MSDYAGDGAGKWNLYGGPYKHRENEIIVGLPHLRLVRRKLDELSIPLQDREASPLLGLASVVLPDVGGAADTIVRAAGGQEDSRRPSGPLDQVLWGLRRIFAQEYADWVPTLGKNRLVGRVHGGGEVSHGGGGQPRPAGPRPFTAQDRRDAPGRGVRVGVLDTAIYPQSWLSGGWAARYADTVIEPGEEASPALGHATFVAGLVLTQAPGATLEVRGVLDANGEADSWDVAREIVLLGQSGLDVLNLSLVCYTEDGEPPLTIAAAIDRLDPELVVIAAAGNHGAARPDDDGEYGGKPDAAPQDDVDERTRKQRVKPAWPAALDDVVGVGAWDSSTGGRADFSPDAPWVDIHAKGKDVTSTFLPRARLGSRAEDFGGYATWSGTSFAAALVSGAVAARTQPGRVSARSALEDLLRPLKGEPGLDRTSGPVLRDLDGL